MKNLISKQNNIIACVVVVVVVVLLCSCKERNSSVELADWISNPARRQLLSTQPIYSERQGAYAGLVATMERCSVQYQGTYGDIKVYTDGTAYLAIVEQSEQEYAEVMWADYGILFTAFDGKYNEVLTNEREAAGKDCFVWRFNMLNAKLDDIQSEGRINAPSQLQARAMLKSITSSAYRGIEFIKNDDYDIVYLKGFDKEIKAYIEIYHNRQVVKVVLEGPDWASVDTLATCLLGNID